MTVVKLSVAKFFILDICRGPGYASPKIIWMLQKTSNWSLVQCFIDPVIVLLNIIRTQTSQNEGLKFSFSSKQTF